MNTNLNLNKIICPFCFEAFNTSDAEFRCNNAGCPRRTPDLVYAKYHSMGVASVMGCLFKVEDRSFFSNFRVRISANCPHCNKETQVRICPNCHFELSHDAGLVKDRVIAIIGGRQTGKGHYIATLIHRLENEVGLGFNFSLRSIGDNTRRRFDEEYHSPLFNDRKLLEPTRSATVNAAVKEPLLFRLTTSNSKGQVKEAVDLSFFDTAGEDMQSLTTLNVEARYIFHAAGIVFLLDPLQIPSVRVQLNPDNLPPLLPDSNPIGIIDRLRDLFEKNGQVAPNQGISIPVAFALSKTDALEPILKPRSQLRQNSLQVSNRFNEQDFQSVHTEVEGYLNHWIGSGITNRINHGFSNFRYCGVSSLGRPPQGGMLQSVNPIRVEDPFLWILKQLHVID
jgi:hypothetical protein